MNLGYSDSNARNGGLNGPIVGTIPLRIASAGVLLYLHTWHQAQAGWQFLWRQQPWELPGLLAKAQFPYAEACAIAATTIAFAVSVSWLLGFLTRFFSILFLPVILGALLAANRLAEHASAETALLYFFISVTLFISGSCWFSTDTLFQIKRSPKKKR